MPKTTPLEHIQYFFESKNKHQSINHKMNIKAMAKSKRSHTKHNQPRKPHHLKPTPIPPSSSSSSSNIKPLNPKKGKNDKKSVETEEPPVPSLPSNWDRYEELEDEYVVDEDEESEEELFDWSSGRPRRFAAQPKGKGASAGMVAQVKETRKNHTVSNDEFFDDFYQGFISTLGVQSDDLLSLDRVDEFLPDIEAATGDEHAQHPKKANLHLLDEKLAERQNLKTEDSSSGKSNPVYVEDVIGSKLDDRSVYAREKLPRIAADALETELDVLLNSFGEAECCESPVAQRNGGALLDIQGDSVPHSLGTSCSAQISSILNDDLDDLLERTSKLNSDDNLVQSTKDRVTDDGSHESSLQHLMGPSRPEFFLSSSNLDEELDKLLEETSKFMIR